MPITEYKSFFKDVTSKNESSICNYTTRLDTYGKGCTHNCSYCYAKGLLSFRGLWNSFDVSRADIEKIKRKINKLDKGIVLRLGGMTDCFQEIEKTYKITYETIKALNKKGIHYLIVTKSDLVAEDEYIRILDKDLAHIQISITSTTDSISKKFENAPSISKRIKAIEKLATLGYDVQIRLSPFIPQFIDFEILNNIKCDKILIEFLRINHYIKKWFPLDYSDYTLKSAGYSHLPLNEKLRYLQNIRNFKEKNICEDVIEHFEYFKNNYNTNREDCCNLKK